MTGVYQSRVALSPITGSWTRTERRRYEYRITRPSAPQPAIGHLRRDEESAPSAAPDLPDIAHCPSTERAHRTFPNHGFAWSYFAIGLRSRRGSRWWSLVGARTLRNPGINLFRDAPRTSRPRWSADARPGVAHSGPSVDVDQLLPHHVETGAVRQVAEQAVCRHRVDVHLSGARRSLDERAEGLFFADAYLGVRTRLHLLAPGAGVVPRDPGLRAAVPGRASRRARSCHPSIRARDATISVTVGRAIGQWHIRHDTSMGIASTAFQGPRTYPCRNRPHARQIALNETVMRALAASRRCDLWWT